ncbi:MAG: hypothetical protein HW374_1006 [Bacteroidetes bacterium]|nr:hypothetical protein [Bacteroidota bacterium]
MNIPEGVAGVEFNDVLFTEEAIPNAEFIKKLTVFIRNQNSSLDDIKRELSNQAKAAGANTVMNFRYGQRLATLWEALTRFEWDIELWYGEGDAVKL